MPDDVSTDDAPTRSEPAGPSRLDDGGDRDAPETTSRTRDEGGRSVVVPDRVYKAVTVFSTLFAVLTVVVGFVVLDRATNRAQAPLSEINPFVALAALVLIVLGAVTYAFSTRFHAEGMGNAKDDTDEPSDNG